ncbi:nucleoside deaminase [Methylosarcina fibrata]|uniref:nucleoside deaminase n=1 Tax=Methylosarcina fibrata TaxID=105972 RepID=UPI0003741B3B|nr:nucleoside deaminase [Methylosarcina fibrata]
MDELFLQRAVEVAVENVEIGGGPYGAVIVRDGVLIASSGNRVTQDLDPTAHAEIMAIRLACRKLNDFQLKGCVLYTSCEPCPMCLGAIYWARLDKVYFACNRYDAAAADFDDSFIYDEISVSPLERKIAMVQLSLPDARLPFQVWSEKNDKIPY